ncbi:MAG: histidinol-phosphate transaminase [Epulopiscium sp.]|nr:histidinol-phosphate transaminase [Candidatus Epulonipiscium sp.]
MISYRKVVESMKPYVPGKPIDEVKRELGLTDVIKLASNENPLGCSKKATEAMIANLEHPSLYPDGNCTKLRMALSDQLGFQPDQFIFGAGSDEILGMITEAFLEQNEEVLTCSPSFPRYASATQLMGGKLIELPLKNHVFDLDGLAAHVTEKTKIIFIANPNNPTGTIYTAEEQRAFLEKIPPHVMVVLDEAYCEYVDDPNYPNSLSMLKDFPNCIVLRTFSKIYGLASLRVGYGVASPSIINGLNRVRGPFNVNTLAQEAAYASLLDDAFVQASFDLNQKAKLDLYKALDEMGLSYIPTQGNFIMIDTQRPSQILFEQLLHKGIITRPGFYFGMDTYLRVTLGTKAQMELFISTLKDLLERK